MQIFSGVINTSNYFKTSCFWPKNSFWKCCIFPHATDRFAKKNKKYMSILGPFLWKFLAAIAFQVGVRVCEFLLRPKNMPIRVGFLIGKAEHRWCWHRKFTNFVKTFVKLFFPIFFAQNRLKVQDTDLVEDAKYVGDASFLSDMPDKNLGFNPKSTWSSVNRW